jgi:hypothetical protein
MSEIEEITNGKTAEELQHEIAFQLSMGENPGGTIIGEIQYRIEQLGKKP